MTDRYTLLVTYDGVLVAGYYADPGRSGASHGLVPESRYAPWVRNATDSGRDGAGDAAGGTGSSGGRAAGDGRSAGGGASAAGSDG